MVQFVVGQEDSWRWSAILLLLTMAAILLGGWSFAGQTTGLALAWDGRDSSPAFAPQMASSISEEVYVTGTIFYDRDGDGFQALNENGIEGVRLELYDDTNANGRIDNGEARIGQTVSDVQGNYVFSPVSPGYRVLRIHPAGIGGPIENQIPLLLTSSEVEGTTFIVDLPVTPTAYEVRCVTGGLKGKGPKSVLWFASTCTANSY